MNGRCLLDTDIIIALFADEAAVKNNLTRVDEVFIPAIAIGELYFGAWKSGRPEENIKRIDGLMASSIILGCDTDTARRYGEIKHSLRLKGRPLPENDIWIAAIALQHHLVLATRDEHFSDIDSLAVVTW